MKDLIFQTLRFTSKLTVFYLFLFIFGTILVYAVIKPAYESIINQQAFTVDGVSKSNFVPDTAIVSAGAIIEGSDVKALKKTADSNLSAATTALIEMGITKEKITSDYSIDPKYDKDYITITGYRANTSLSVETKDFTQIDGILDIVLANDFNRVDGVYFSFEDPTAIRESLRSEAIEAAKAKAEKIAEESGLRLGKLLNVYEGNYYPYDNYRVNSYMESEALDSTSETSQSYNPGETEMQMSVTLIYEVY